MFSADDDGQTGLVLGIVFAVLALVLVLTLVLVVAMQRAGRTATAPRPAASAAVAAGPQAALPGPEAASEARAPGADDASIKVEYGVVMFYFASGQSGLAAGAGEALGDLVQRLTPGRKLIISGFHDTSGDAVKNAGLARQRALAVRDALLKAGVPAGQLQLNQPRQAAADGAPAQARRVEVTLE